MLSYIECKITPEILHKTCDIIDYPLPEQHYDKKDPKELRYKSQCLLLYRRYGLKNAHRKSDDKRNKKHGRRTHNDYIKGLPCDIYYGFSCHTPSPSLCKAKCPIKDDPENPLINTFSIKRLNKIHDDEIPPVRKDK